MNNLNEHIEELEKRLTAAEKKENKILAAGSVVDFMLFLFLFVLLSVIVEFALNMGSNARTVYFILFVCVAVILIIFLLAVPILSGRNKHSRADHLASAGKAGINFQFIKDDLKNILQIAYDNNIGYSDELITAAVKEGMKKFAEVDFAGAISFKPVVQKAKIVIPVIFIIVCSLVFVAPLHSAMNRLISFQRDFTPPAKYLFFIKPGNASITKGENVDITIQLNDNSVSEIYLHIKSEDETDYQQKRLMKNANGMFQANIPNVQNSFSYYASIEGFNSGKYSVTAINRPIIMGFEIEIIPPPYSNLPKEYYKDNGNINALTGSKINFTLRTSKELKEAYIEFSDSSSTGLKIDGNKAIGELKVTKEAAYHFRIVDTGGFGNSNPAEYLIKPIRDEYPTIKILSPENNFNARAVQKLNIISRISDDFGFSKLCLFYRKSEVKYEKPDEKYSEIQISLKPDSKEQDLFYNWDIAKLNLTEGDVVSYYLEVFDNDYVSGPKGVKSEIYTLRIPAIDDVINEAGNKALNIEKEMKEILKDAQRLNDEFKKSVNDLKKDKRELNWEEKNNIAGNLENLEKVQSKIEDVKKKLSDFRKELKGNDLLSDETLEKYKELQNLFDELNSEEFKQSIQKLQDALKSMMRDSVQKSLDKTNFDEEYLKNSIERTINLFKRIKIEQKTDELLKRVRNLNEKTSGLQSELQQNPLNEKQSGEESLNRQKDISGGIKNLESEMKNTERLMKELSDMPEAEMKKLIEEFNKQKNDDISQNIGKAIKQFKNESALSGAKTLSKNFSSLEELISQMQKSFLQKNQMKTFAEMMKAMSNIVALSKDQEKLRIETEALQFNSNLLKEKQLAQNELKNSLQKIIQQIADLSQKTFGITPEMGGALGYSMLNMQNAVNALQNMGGAAPPNQRNAMQGLNKAASLLKGSMDKMMSGGKAGGMMSLMQQLQQLSQKQMDLNRLTQQLNQGGLTQQELSQLQRLAQQQDLIRKSLEKLNREAQDAGQSKSLAGSLDKALEEMKSVVKEMNGNKLDNEIVKKQERILSRMLDSQRSINEKDYEKNREANTGAEFNLVSPGQLNQDENSNKLKTELLKALKEGYKKDYEELIKRYFEALEKQGNKK